MRKSRAGERLSNSPVKLVPISSRHSGNRQAVFRDVVMLFYATTGRLQRLRRLIASSVGLNSAEYSIAAALYRLGPKTGSRVKEIADYLHMAPENVTTAVGNLVEKNWAIKAIDPSDARAVTLRLHPAGRKRIDKLTDELREVNDVWFQEMTGAEIQMLIIFLERVLNGFDGAFHRAKEKFPPQTERGDEHD